MLLPQYNMASELTSQIFNVKSHIICLSLPENKYYRKAVITWTRKAPVIITEGYPLKCVQQINRWVYYMDALGMR